MSIKKKTTKRKTSRKKTSKRIKSSFPSKRRRNPNLKIEKDEAFRIGKEFGLEDKTEIMDPKTGQSFWGVDLLAGYFAHVDYVLKREGYKPYLYNWNSFIDGYSQTANTESDRKKLIRSYSGIKPILLWHINAYYYILCNRSVTFKEIDMALNEGHAFTAFILYNLKKLGYIKKSTTNNKYAVKKIVEKTTMIGSSCTVNISELIKKERYFKDLDKLLQKESKFKYKK